MPFFRYLMVLFLVLVCAGLFTKTAAATRSNGAIKSGYAVGLSAINKKTVPAFPPANTSFQIAKRPIGTGNTHFNGTCGLQLSANYSGFSLPKDQEVFFSMGSSIHFLHLFPFHYFW